MSDAFKLQNHGRDHRPGGSDPIYFEDWAYIMTNNATIHTSSLPGTVITGYPLDSAISSSYVTGSSNTAVLEPVASAGSGVSIRIHTNGIYEVTVDWYISSGAYAGIMYTTLSGGANGGNVPSSLIFGSSGKYYADMQAEGGTNDSVSWRTFVTADDSTWSGASQAGFTFGLVQNKGSDLTVRQCIMKVLRRAAFKLV